MEFCCFVVKVGKVIFHRTFSHQYMKRICKLKNQLVALLVVSSVYLSGCNSEASEAVSNENTQTGITYEVIHSGISAYVPEVLESHRSAKVFIGELAYEADLAKYDEEQPIAVDLGGSSIVALSTPSNPPFDSLVSIVSVEEFEHHVMVNVLVSDPASSCLFFGSPAEASYFYAVINTRKKIVFNEQYEMRAGC